MNNPLQPLADALLAARRADSTWPEPLDWLAEQVLERCSPEYPHDDRNCRVCADTHWVAKDPAAWPEGWATGLGLKWWNQSLRRYRHQKWYDVLGDALNDSTYIEGERDAIAALVEAVKGIAEVPHA